MANYWVFIFSIQITVNSRRLFRRRGVIVWHRIYFRYTTVVFRNPDIINYFVRYRRQRLIFILSTIDASVGNSHARVQPIAATMYRRTMSVINNYITR